MCRSALSLPLARNFRSRHKNENSIVFVLVHLHVAIIIGCSRYLNRWSYVAWEDALSRTRLMTTPPQFVLSLLSRQLYLDCFCVPICVAFNMPSLPNGLSFSGF